MDARSLQTGEEPLNPQFHEEFVALCALYYSEEISEEEWALLQIHMSYCDECHNRFLEHQLLTSDLIPAMASIAASESGGLPDDSAGALEAAERRLMSRLSSTSNQPKLPEKRRNRWRIPVALVAACLVMTACAVGFYRIRLQKKSETQLTSQIPFSQTQPSAAPNIKKASTNEASKNDQSEIAALQKQLLAGEAELRQSNLTIAALQQQIQSDQTARQQASQEKQTLSQQLLTTQTEANSLTQQSATDKAVAAQQSAREETLEAKIRELNASLEEKDMALSQKDQMLALDKDFLAHDRDIRDLIGARNLYIADIFDTTENGKTAKQFGRIFYTKDRSLVFYGFDLDKQAGLKRDVSFQVWGSGSDKPVISLGLFYQDDTNKRWILRCDDAKTLARLDMVFVTVEPPGGSAKPTGKQLLRAYLQIPPNHP